MDNPNSSHKKAAAKPTAKERANNKPQSRQDKSDEHIRVGTRIRISGGFGIVVKVVNKLGEHQALKLPKLTTGKKAIKQEIDILASAGKHQRLVEFQGVIKTEYGTGLMFELLLPRTLGALMDKRMRITEAEVRWFIPKIAEGIQYLNSKGLAHCDLKPGNILLASDMTPKLADLGLSERLGPGAKDVCGFRGTPGYVAPEVFKKGTPHTFKMDIFSLGVIVCMMLKGGRPNLTDRTKAYEERLAPLLDDKALSQPAVKLLERLLAFNPKKRMRVDDIENDTFFTSGFCPVKLSQEAFDQVPDFLLLGKHIHDDDNSESDKAHERPKFKKFRTQPPPAIGARDGGEAWKGSEVKNDGEFKEGNEVKNDSSANEDGQGKDKDAVENQLPVPKGRATGVKSILAEIPRAEQSVSKRSATGVESASAENKRADHAVTKKANTTETVEQQRQEYEERERADKEVIRAGYGDVDDECVDMALLVYSATPDGEKASP
ncbi:hypothetical protein BGZ95_002438 [Linnemannia exigua]|uniref:Protein kinase domain-containing protein n=1 Tax=Linnemannia exigua TaxID=604196 RepID=A0AAD4D786_9FUNG|nr:hypothetical protein BGZ95_002438 [Linnemannia exigua]